MDVIIDVVKIKKAKSDHSNLAFYTSFKHKNTNP